MSNLQATLQNRDRRVGREVDVLSATGYAHQKRLYTMM
jgi:hypothetical protein